MTALRTSRSDLFGFTEFRTGGTPSRILIPEIDEFVIADPLNLNPCAERSTPVCRNCEPSRMRLLALKIRSRMASRTASRTVSKDQGSDSLKPIGTITLICPPNMHWHFEVEFTAG